MTPSPFRSRPTAPPPRGGQPAINLPPAVKALLLANLAVFGLQMLLSPETEGWVVFNLGFLPARYTLAPEIGWQGLLGPLTHQFLHGGWLHLGVNMIMLAAFGSGVERALGAQRTLFLYIMSGFAGALAHFALYPEAIIPVVGASGAISGLFGVVLRIMGAMQAANGGFRRMLPVAILWMAIAVVTGFTGVPGTGGAQVAWAAHIGGFLAGLILFDLVRPRRRSEA